LFLAEPLKLPIFSHDKDEINSIALTQFGIAQNLLPCAKVIICL
jgi:hypothetical protein